MIPYPYGAIEWVNNIAYHDHLTKDRCMLYILSNTCAFVIPSYLYKR